jgi:hypothetical protein
MIILRYEPLIEMRRAITDIVPCDGPHLFIFFFRDHDSNAFWSNIHGAEDSAVLASNLFVVHLTRYRLSKSLQSHPLLSMLLETSFMGKYSLRFLPSGRAYRSP